MEGVAALVLALLSIPFLLPIISFVMTRRLRSRVEDLEAQIERQEDRINGLSASLAQLRKEGVAPAAPPAPSAQPAAVHAPPALATPPIVEDKRPIAPPVIVPPVFPPPVITAPAAVPPIATPPKVEEQPRTVAASPPPIVPPPVGPPPRPPISPPGPPFTTEPDPEPEVPAPSSWSFDWERLVGVRLFSAIAGIALVFAAVFFLRYSIDQGWLQPPVRVAIGTIVAIALLVVCELKAARKYELLANVMDAAAIAILFATFFAAHSLWNLIAATTTFGLLALVTLTAVLLSIRRESMFIAVLGLLGGFATPILLSTGENRPVPLFALLLLLNIGLAWVAYRQRWPVLSVLTLALTTLYQWGWVARYLDSAQVPLAIGIFTIFPVVGYGMLLAARSRRDSNAGDEPEYFEWTALAAALVPAAFAIYLGAAGVASLHYALLLGWVLVIAAAMLAIAIARSAEPLHAIGALTSVAVVVLISPTLQSHVAAGIGFVTAFVALFLAAPAVATRFGRPFEGLGRHALMAAPLLLAVFPLLVDEESTATASIMFFAPLLLLMLAIAWRGFAEQQASRLFFTSALFALATKLTWTSAFLTPAALTPATAVFATFALFYFAVSHYARQRGTPLRPAFAPGLLLIAAMLLLIDFTQPAVATNSLWHLVVLLAIFSAALFVESAASSISSIALAGTFFAWVLFFAWWQDGAAANGVLSSLLALVVLTLVMIGGYLRGLRHEPATSSEPSLLRRPVDGFWLVLISYFFLWEATEIIEWAIPPAALFAALGVVVLAFSTAALAARKASFHLASVLLAGTVLMTWRNTAQPAGHAAIAIGAFAALVFFGLAWIRVSGAQLRVAAIAAAGVLVLFELDLVAMIGSPLAAALPLMLGSHVVALSLLLSLAFVFAWQHAIPAVALLGGLGAVSILNAPVHTGRDVLLFAGVLYAPFALFPFVLGRRAQDNRDPYIAALIAAVWCFFIARRGMTLAGLEWMVGVVPVLIGAVTTLHLSQLLRLQPAGQRDLGRLALVAGSALAFLTVAIPLQLRQQWITIGWALEGAAVAWLFTRIPHRGLLMASIGLLGAVFLRLALNPDVFRYEPRGDLRIWNWYLYTYLIAAAAMGLAAWWLSKTDDSLAASAPRPRHLLPAAAAIVLFLLLNIEIADFYSTGPDILFRFGSSIQQDLTYTIAWLIFGILMLVAGIVAKAKPARVASVALIAVTTFKCFLYDLSSLGGLYRVGAFVGLAISLALVSIALQKYVLAPEREATL